MDVGWGLPQALSQLGLDLMRLLAQGDHIPAIALSGFGTAADIGKSKAAGFAEHLTTPISPDLIAAAIQRVMSHPKLVNGGRKASRLIADAPP